MQVSLCCKCKTTCMPFVKTSHSIQADKSLSQEFTINPLNDNPKKWSNSLKQFVGKLPMNCLSRFHHFVGLALKGLTDTKTTK